jgi:pimeloyl-ACP methyl ester carboxylesterase
VRGYEYRQNGQVVGRSFGRYDGEVEVGGRTLYRFSARMERVVDRSAPGGADLPDLRGMSEILLDESGRLVSGFERSASAELRFKVESGELKAEAITGVPRDESWSTPVDENAAFMGYMTAFYEELTLATRPLVNGEQNWPLISLSTAQVDAWTGTASLNSDGIKLRTSLGERIDLVDGRIVFAEVPDIELEVRPMTEARWPNWEIDPPRRLTYQKPEALELRELELPGRAGEPRLAGELVLPPHEAGKPLPAIVFLGGSAAADRHGFAGPPAVDLGSHEITDALALAGFAVLRYDGRGVGGSAFGPTSWQGQIEDGRRAFRTLLVQPEVDPDRIIVVGHGEGGWRALKLGAEYGKSVAGVVLLGTPGRSYRRIIGASQPDLLKALESGGSLPSVLEGNRAWYKEIIEEKPVVMLGKGKAPVWAAHGSTDLEFDAEIEMAELRLAAKEAGRELELELFDGLDHLFKVGSAGANMSAYLEERPVDPSFLAALVEWATEKAGKKAP